MGLEIGLTVLNKLMDLLKLIFKRKQPSDAIIDSINIRVLAEELIKKGLGVDCFFLVMVHNHGGKVRPDNFMFWSVIDGAYDKNLMNGFEFKNYQLVNTELDFLQLAKRIYEKKEIEIRVNEMEPGSLRTSFEYEKLKYLRCFYLKQDKRGLWFIMVGTTAQDELLAQIEQKGKIFIAVNNVKNIIRGY